MASTVRRAAAALLKLIAGTDPAAESGRVVAYAKAVGGIAQLFARTSDATIYQLTPSDVAVIGVHFTDPGTPANNITIVHGYLAARATLRSS